MNFNKLRQSFILFFIFCFFGLFSTYAQTIITEKSEKKVSISPQIGLSVFPGISSFDKLGLPNNLFSGYGISPMVGIGFWYKAAPKISVGTELNYIFAQRNINSLGLLGTGLKGKYNFINPRKLISPYLSGGVNLWFANINQGKQIRDYYPEDTSGAGHGIRTDRVDYRYNQLSIYFAPILGLSVGAGVDVKINQKISIFFQASLQGSLATSDMITSHYPRNNGTLQYLSFQGGTNIRFFKKVKFEIDTLTIPIPDAIVSLNPEENFDDENYLLTREGTFLVNLREGMHHAVSVNVSNKEINLELDENPCEKIARLFDDRDRLITEVSPDVRGKVNFGNLPKGKYKVVIAPKPPCEKGIFSYHLNGDGVDVLSQSNENSIPDSLRYVVDGFIELEDKKKSRENTIVMLVNVSNNQVIATGKTDQQGRFNFDHLGAKSYKIVYQPLPLNSSTKLDYEVKDGKNNIIKKELTAFLAPAKKEIYTTRLLTGNVALTDNSIPSHVIKLHLVDKNNRIIASSFPDERGNFEFLDNDKLENQVIAEVLALPYAATQSLIAQPTVIKSISYNIPKKVNTEAVLPIISSTNSIIEEKMNEVPQVLSMDLKMYKLYNLEGQIPSLNGWGFQVGAYCNIQNVVKMMQKLKSEGHESYVQSLMMHDISKRFRSKENYKVNRVIVFAGESESRSTEVKQMLSDNGYEIIVKEHFHPETEKLSPLGIRTK